jgi:inosose dehydratase
MTNPMNRRTFGKTMLAGLGAAAALPTLTGTAATRKLKIGETTLIWGAVPRSPEKLEPAVKDISALGYHGWETFAAILEDWETKGTLKGLLDANPSPLWSAYASLPLIDATTRKDNLQKLIGWGKIVKKYGGHYMVLASNGVKRESYDFNANKSTIVATLNEFATAMTDLGLRAGLHQHTGTAVDTRDETYAIMEAVNTKVCKFAPDVGQLQKSGTDAAKVVKDFLEITDHMHLKDYLGGEHMAGYCPLGLGKVDLKAILDMMDEKQPKSDVMVELDGSANMPYTPLETAQISKAFLEKQGFTFRTS